MAYKLEEDGKWRQVSVDKNKVSPSDGASSGNSGTQGSSGSSSETYSSRIQEPVLLDDGSGDLKSGADQSAQDKFNEVSYKICEGSLTPVVAIPQMASRICINVLGVGNMLSGKYYVKSTQLSMDKNGLSQTIDVRKTEFGGYTRLTDDSRDGRPSPLIR